jgi:hypothetical protein
MSDEWGEVIPGLYQFAIANAKWPICNETGYVVKIAGGLNILRAKQSIIRIVCIKGLCFAHWSRAFPFVSFTAL